MSMSAQNKALGVAAILSLICVGVLYFVSREEVSQSADQVRNRIESAASADAFDGVQLINEFGLTELKVEKNGASIYSYSAPELQSGAASALLPLDHTISSNEVKASYSLSPSPAFKDLLIRLAAAVVSIFLSAAFAVSIVIKNNQKDIVEMRKAIVDKRYDDLPYEEITQVLTKQERENTTKLKDALEKVETLETQAAIDPLTGLFNRNMFKRDFTRELTKQTNGTSILGIIRSSSVQDINQSRGYQMGDKYIHDVAELVNNAIKTFNNAKAYRISGSDFAILIPGGKEEQIVLLNQDLKVQIESFRKDFDFDSICYSGYTLFTNNEREEVIFSRADFALARAQTGPINGYYVQKEDTEGYLQGEMHWRQTVLDIINRKAITLYYQPIRSMNISIRPYFEIYARFFTKDGEALSTESILAAALRHDLLVRLEEMIIEAIISKYRKLQKGSDARFGINLSANALISTSFLLWLERTLLRNADIAPNLVFEIDEQILSSNVVAAERLFSIIGRSHANTSISHFGHGIESFTIYRDLKPNYIKLDPNLCQKFDTDLSSLQFIRMIIEVSHRLGCVVVAEGVESVAQKQHLENLYIDAVQGYVVAKPAELTDDVDLEKEKNGPAPEPRPMFA
ncbi:MAG: EAL domain-containing protein [Succinimonas sp.]|nr:EAL domain-containing protein [Succinimonas sp.]